MAVPVDAAPVARSASWRRPRGVPLAVLAAIAIAWAIAVAAEASGLAGTVHHDALLVDGPPFALALAAFLLAWQVMIAAMMLPSSLPLVRLFAVAARGQRRPAAAMAALLSGYALVWSAFGALALVLDLALHRGVESVALLREHEWLIGGAVLAGAGAFQFTPLKDACLRTCRRPEQFLVRHYRQGAAGAFALGGRHGLFCVGCCWALMGVMLAAGAASLVWMALLTALMVHEKTRPAGRQAVPVTGAALLGLASLVLAHSAYQAGVI